MLERASQTMAKAAVDGEINGTGGPVKNTQECKSGLRCELNSRVTLFASYKDLADGNPSKVLFGFNQQRKNAATILNVGARFKNTLTVKHIYSL